MLKNKKLKFVGESGHSLGPKATEFWYVLDMSNLNNLTVSKFIKLFKNECGKDYIGIVLCSKDYPKSRKMSHTHEIFHTDSNYVDSLIYKLSKNKKILSCEVSEIVYPEGSDFGPLYRAFLVIDI